MLLTRQIVPLRVIAGAPVALALLLGGCKGDDPVGPAVVCDAASVTQTVTLTALTGTRVNFAGEQECAALATAGATYLLVPQFASGGGNQSPQQHEYFIGNDAGSATLAASLARRTRAGIAQAPNAQQRFDAWLRAQEHALVPQARVQRERFAAGLSARVTAAQFATTRTFKTLGNINGTSFRTVTATLKYEGQNIVIYVDNATPSGGFTDSALTKFGQLFDQVLYPIDTAAFGKPTDIDVNGKLVVLMTPRVNALVTSTECNTDGFITGYFLGTDLVSTDTSRSNKGEVFYTFTPDIGGEFSCAHDVDDVERIVPATFIHELQHMISFGAHVLQRNGDDEEVWLNEGLSLIAEEFGSLYYENKYPAPTGRTNPTQLFPDSAQGYIVNNLVYAFEYLDDAPNVSITTFENSGTLPERGGSFLFLRWLGDHKGAGVFRALVQTGLTGIANVSAAAGEPFPALFSDFGISTYTDSIPGVARSAVPVRYRFTSRNLRQLHQRLADLGAVSPIYPVQPQVLPASGGATGSMLQGTMYWYRVTVPGSGDVVPMHFVDADHRAFASSLVPQVGIFRLPSP